MLESSSASRQIVLLLLVTGLLLAAWSMDGGNRARDERRRMTGRKTVSRSAIAVLTRSMTVDVEMENDRPWQLSAAEKHDARAGRSETGDGLVELPVEAPLPLMLRSKWLVTERPVTAPIPVAVSDPARAPLPLVISEPVEAPVPVACSDPVEAPIPVACSDPARAPIPLAASEPVAAPVPMALATSARSNWIQCAETLLSRTRMNYRISCWHCGNCLDTAERRIAAVGRQTRHSLDDLAEALSQAVREVVRNAHLPDESASDGRGRF